MAPPERSRSPGPHLRERASSSRRARSAQGAVLSVARGDRGRALDVRLRGDVLEPECAAAEPARAGKCAAVVERVAAAARGRERRRATVRRVRAARCGAWRPRRDRDAAEPRVAPRAAARRLREAAGAPPPPPLPPAAGAAAASSLSPNASRKASTGPRARARPLGRARGRRGTARRRRRARGPCATARATRRMRRPARARRAGRFRARRVKGFAALASVAAPAVRARSPGASSAPASL